MEISPALVKELRARTGAGIMDCKKALMEAQGDIEAAETNLRKKGVDTAAKKSDRQATEGLIGSYIHTNGKIGVLLELDCETDFVARTDEFKQLLKDLCMQVAATNPLAIDKEDVPADVLEREKEIASAGTENKPPQVVEKIVNGRLEKFYAEKCLLEQPFVKDDSRKVRDIITDAIAKFGENIVVRRFTRFAIGE